MILLADGGSTKTTWALLEENGDLVRQWTTAGINPYQQTEATISTQLKELFAESAATVKTLYYYGAGATSSASKKLIESFKSVFNHLQKIDIQSDIVAAAYALCGNEAGIVCILGTGSNSAVYDGKTVIENVGGFGFILGDEGSGAVMGKQLMMDYLYRSMPKKIHQQLQAEYHLNDGKILQQVYNSPFPNRFLASFAPFLAKNKAEIYISELINTQINAFLQKKVLCYDQAPHYPIHFTGSIAYFFQDVVRAVAQQHQLKIGTIVQAPMAGLLAYHQGKLQG